MRITITLLLLNLFVASWIFQLEMESNTPEENKQIFNIRSDEITRIHIKKKQGSIIRMKKNGDGWMITKPVVWPANPNAVQRLVNRMVYLEKEVAFQRDRVSGQTMEEYGLKDPILEISIAVGKEPQAYHTLKCGSPTRMKDRIYALEPGGDKVAILSSQILQEFSLKVDDLRQQNIFDMPLYAIDAILVKMNSPDITLRLAKEQDEWVFESPVQEKADSDRVGRLLNLLESMKIKNFVNEDKENAIQSELSQPTMRVTLQGQNNQQTIILNGKIKQDDSDSGNEQQNLRYAQLEGRPSFFTVTSVPFDMLKEHWERLRDHQLLRFENERVNSIHIKKENNELILQKLETGPWKVLQKKPDEETQAYPADAESIRGLLNHLRTMRADSFVSDAPSQKSLKEFGLEPPRSQITLKTEKSGQDHILYLGKDISGTSMRYVKNNSRETVFGVSADVLRVIQAKPYAYRSRKLLQQPDSAKLHHMKLYRIGTKTRHLFPFQSPNASSENQNQTNKQKNLPSDISEAAKIHEPIDPTRFLPLEVQAWLPEKALATNGNKPLQTQPQEWAYYWSLTFKLPGGADETFETHEYHLNDPESSRRALYGKRIPDGQPFILSARIKNELIDLIRKLNKNNPSPDQ